MNNPLEFYADHFVKIATELDFQEKSERAAMSKFTFKLVTVENESPDQIERWADKLILHRDNARKLQIRAELYREIAGQFRADLALAEETEGKTIPEWLNELPDGYRERALVNHMEYFKDTKATQKYDSMDSALTDAFVWSNTAEGNKFWESVYDHYDEGTPLPPLPQNS